MHDLPPLVRMVTSRLLALLDARLPGQLEAFYLVGSVAQGDFRVGRSDIDFVAVLAEKQDAAALAAIHEQLAREFPGQHCDGIYLRPGELAHPPGGVGIAAREGRVAVGSADERHAVTWLILAQSGVALRGRAPDTRWVAADRDAAIAHSRANLETYWRPWVERRRRLLSPGGLELLAGAAVTWGCLGMARLHTTIANGHVPSKTGAGEQALVAFPEHGPILSEALRLRSDPRIRGGYVSPLRRRRDAIAFMDAVLGSLG